MAPSEPRRMSAARKSAGIRRQHVSSTDILSDQSESPSSPHLESLNDEPFDPLPRNRSPHDQMPLGDITADIVNEQNQNNCETLHIKCGASPVTLRQEHHSKMVAMAQDKFAMETAQPVEAPRRTVIKHLVLQNFKSYAGRQEVGPFHTSFSSVVGPNGSGKSNVIDSLLFVFGFRASKMRQAKLSSLIHNSAAFPDLDHCEVQVHFEEIKDWPNDGWEVVEDSRLVISRKAFRNNSSKYYINDKESNFTAVTTLLKDRGVDLDHKRFLILQGEVESIAQMKPKATNEHDDGLLEYLEDIIGTSKYKKSIEESVTEMEALNEVCTEKNSRVQHVEREKKNLEGKRNAALSFVRDENDLAMKQSALCQVYIHECADNIQISEEAVQKIQAKLDVELGKHRDGQSGIQQLERKYELHQQEYSAIETSTQATIKNLARSDKEAVKIDEERKHLNSKVKKLEKIIIASEAGLNEAFACLLRLQDDLKLNNQNTTGVEESLKTEETQLTKIRESLHGKTAGLSNGIVMKQKELEPWTERANQKQSAIDIAQSELAILLSKRGTAIEALSKLEVRLRGLQANRQEKDEQICQLQHLRDTSCEKRSRLQRETDHLSASEEYLKSRVSTIRQQASEAKSSLAKGQTQGAVLAGLKRLNESGRITGFHGRLGNLGTIDAKYDVAISTACPALQNIVVDTVEAAQQCIGHLRKNNLGRANFILLDRLQSQDVAPIPTPENVPRLFDLVRSKEDQFLPAFFSIMHNTLVAADLEQANRIAFGAKRWRVVTLDGHLIDKSGTMSGGGARVATGAMSAKPVMAVSTEQVNQLQVQQDHEEQKMEKFKQDMDHLTTAIRKIDDDLPAFETQIQRLQLELSSIDRDVADVVTRRDELASSTRTDQKDQARIESLRSCVSNMETEIMDLQKTTSSIEMEIKTLQDKIMEIGGVKLRIQKAKVDGLRDQGKVLAEEASSAEIDQIKAQKQHDKHSRTKCEAEAGLVSTNMVMLKLAEQSEQQSQTILRTKQEAEDAEERLAEERERMAALKIELDRKTAELNQTRYLEVELRNKLEESQKCLTDNQKRQVYWKEKLGKLGIKKVVDEVSCDFDQVLTTYTNDELADLDKEILKGQIAVLEEKLQNAEVDLSVIDEYQRRVDEHAERSTDLAQALAARDSTKRRSEDLRRLRLEGFMTGFSMISLRLKEMYQMITMGGNAELELVDSLDPFSEGILFSVMPPKKSWKNISNLSGGEKTLSSLALVFALHHYKPTPLYVMDEIDAALDFRNVSIVASYIKERTKNAQFIVISLRNNMFELASRLVGVYKVNHMTKSVTVENRDYVIRG